MNKDLRKLIKRQQSKETGEYIYVAYCAGYTKIGISNDVNKRIKALQTASPFQVIKYFLVFLKNAQVVEWELHSQYKDKQIRGEWFYLNDNERDALCDRLTELFKKENRLDNFIECRENGYWGYKRRCCK
jgi:hypothetical protein